MIDYFGARQLDSSFFYLLFMTAPVWIAMIALPRNRLVHVVASPFLAPLFFLPVLFYIFWQAQAEALLPAVPTQADYQSARAFARHPIAFLALFCKLQILNLFLGTVLFQKARAVKISVPVELLICWFIGPLALLPFSVRLLLRRRSLKLF